MKNNDEENGFIQGVGLAIAYLQRHYSETSIAQQLMRESGIKLLEFEKVCDNFDIGPIREVACDLISKKSFFNNEGCST